MLLRTISIQAPMKRQQDYEHSGSHLSRSFCKNWASYLQQRRDHAQTSQGISPLLKIKEISVLVQLMQQLHWPSITKGELRVFTLICRVYFFIRRLVTF